jgi:DNA-binding Xre family transcriptional regulator
MAANYTKLFKLLLDRKIKKSDLCRAAGIGATSLTKLTKGENVTTDILVKICNALHCDFADIMEMEFDTEQVELPEGVESGLIEQIVSEQSGGRYVQKSHRRALGLRLRRYLFGYKVTLMVVKSSVKK